MQSTGSENDAVVPPGVPMADIVLPSPPSYRAFSCKRLYTDLLDKTAEEPAQKKSKIAAMDSSQSTTTKRKVTFAADEAEVTRVDRLEKALWYSREDLLFMKNNAKNLCRRINMDFALSSAYGLPLDCHEDQERLPQVVRSHLSITL